MIGVVVWSNADREKAVIWCEDHGALAYLQGRENLLHSMQNWPEPGDLLELDSELVGPLRHARSVAMIGEGHCPRLPEMLRSAGAPERPSHLQLVSSRDAVSPLRADQGNPYQPQPAGRIAAAR